MSKVMKKKSARSTASAAIAADPAPLDTTAGALSARIREVHMPYGTIMDPVFASPESDEIVSYTRTGDSAIWTGHFLAAEAFRYRVTKSAVALENVKAALAGIQRLIDVTNINVLARVVVPADSPYAAAIQREEGGHGVFQAATGGSQVFWIGNTTRDQYSGVMFGLGAAWELVDEVRSQAAELSTRMVRYLVDHGWIVRMPDGKISTVFLQRPDQQLAFIQIARKAASRQFNSTYKTLQLTLSAFTSVPVAYEVLDDHHSYFKFNLDTINLYSLIHFEDDGSLFKKAYRKAYDLLRRTTDDHCNAHFNMLDRAIKGPDATRDGQTIECLSSWLQRPRRDPFVDLRGKLKAAGDDRASEVIPVEERPTTDFLWQRSPFLLYGGGVGLVEGPGIDFILPYWMARFYAVL
jgi:hypothetical protein